MRKIKFETGKFYHIYNRGVDKRQIFMDEKDYLRFLEGLRELNTSVVVESLRRVRQMKKTGEPKTEPWVLSAETDRTQGSVFPVLVEIIAYCLNPNHYHLLLKQLVDGGISKFMQKINQSYTKYFNQKYNRTGPLVASPFKAVEIKSDYQLWYVSAYINGNPEIHQITQASKWPWSSYQDYLEIKEKRNLVSVAKNIILKDFKNIKDYEDYVREVVKNSSEIKEELKKAQIE